MTTSYVDKINSPEFQSWVEQNKPKQEPEVVEPAANEGKLFDLSMKRTKLKLEQNLGCELPVCVASNRDTRRHFIEVVTDEGVIWRLTRKAGGHLPAPDHYPYWLWFLDRCQAAAECGHTDPPKVAINPAEIFDLFGAPKRGKRGGYDGSRYDALDAAFLRFSSLFIEKHAGFYDGKAKYSGSAHIGTLCHYTSWRVDPDERQHGFELVKAFVQPGPLLWASIKAGYLKSVPLEPIKHLTYVEQRLLTYLAKHCKPGGEFAISPAKLLPKIPLHLPGNLLKPRLGPRHEALARVGFLDDARIEGRGKKKLLVYQRTSKVFQSRPLCPSTAKTLPG